MKIKYWRIGTDPTKYIKNWLEFVYEVNIGEKVSIIGFDIVKTNNQQKLISFSSKTTLDQNISVWEMIGLCKQTAYDTLLILDNETQTFDEIIEKLKWGLLIPSKNRKLRILQQSIIARVLFVENLLPPDVEFVPQKDDGKGFFSKDVIKKDSALLDRILREDKEFINLINKKWKGNNND